MTELATNSPCETAPDPIAPNISGEPIRGATEADTIRESVRELNKKREQDGTLGRDEIVDRKWGGEGPVKLRDAGRAFSDAHKTELAREYLANVGMPDVTDEQAFEVGDAAAQLGRKPSELPMVEIGVASNDGKPHRPLDDMSAIIGDRATTEPATGNLREVTRAVTNFREAAEAQRQQLLAELQDAQAAAEQAAGGQQETSQPTPQHPPPAQPPPPQQPDAAQVERAQIEWDKADQCRNAAIERRRDERICGAGSPRERVAKHSRSSETGARQRNLSARPCSLGTGPAS